MARSALRECGGTRNSPVDCFTAKRNWVLPCRSIFTRKRRPRRRCVPRSGRAARLRQFWLSGSARRSKRSTSGGIAIVCLTLATQRTGCRRHWLRHINLSPPRCARHCSSRWMTCWRWFESSLTRMSRVQDWIAVCAGTGWANSATSRPRTPAPNTAASRFMSPDTSTSM
jgi:hypothetical protein